MIDQEQSEQFFNNRLRPVLEEVESLRKEILEKGKRNKLLLSGFGILIFLYSYTEVQKWADTPMQKFWLSALLVVFLVAGYMAVRPEMFLFKAERNRLANLFKNGIVREIVRYANKSFNYHEIFKTNIRLFDRSKLFIQKITEYKETYGITGALGDLDVRIAEVQLRNMLTPYFEGWFVHFDRSFQLPDMLLTTAGDRGTDEKYANYSEGVCEGVQVLWAGGGELPGICKELAPVLKKHNVKNAKSIVLSVVDGVVYLAIENEGLMFELSFRDDNQNYIGAYVDFTHILTVSDFMTELANVLVEDKAS